VKPSHDGASAVHSGVIHDEAAGAIAVWVTRNGVRRIGPVTPEMIDEGHWDAQAHPTLIEALQQLAQYFSGKRKRFDLPLDLSGATEFQRRTYHQLMEIPYGRIVSYGHIADELSEPGAARAVGQAVGANPLPIVIPCHRVVRSDHKLGGYSGGLRLKVTLLGIEGIDVDGHQSGSRVQPELLRLPL
jgi:methylated-DNA-[protein]-cysteine S-methyltransferase